MFNYGTNIFQCNKENFIAVIFSLVCGCKMQNNKLVLHRAIQYPRSTFIKSFSFNSEPYRYPGTGTDMHWWTWGIDGNIYVIDDDGRNFGGISWYAHLLKATKTPPNFKVEEINDFQFYDFRQHVPNNYLRRYVCGIVAVDSSLFVCIYDYDWNISSKYIPSDTLTKRIRELDAYYGVDSVLEFNMRFAEALSKHGGVAGIIVSHDFGKTWSNLPDENTPQFFSPKFGAPAFLTFGPGNSEVPDELKPYIYAISNDGNWASGDNIYLGRVHRDSIIHRDAWSFVSNVDGNRAIWTKDLTNAQPIFTDKGHTGHPSITYNKSLKRYILAVFSDFYPHNENATPEEYITWNWRSELQLYESEKPWGPWSIFYNNDKWGGDSHTCYLLQMPSAWISDGGLNGTALFSGDYINRTGEYYGFITQSYEIELFE